MIRTGDGHDEFKDWAGAYVLGALEPDERRVFLRHVERCERCHAEVDDFTPIPGLLSRLELDRDIEWAGSVDVEHSLERIATLAAARAAGELNSLQIGRLRWKRAALVASAAATLLLITALAVGGSTSGPSNDEMITALQLTDSVATGTVSIDARPWGTAIAVDLVDLPAREQYRLWAVDAAGDRQAAATWGPTPAGAAVVSGATAFSLDDLTRIEITSNDVTDLLLAALK